MKRCFTSAAVLVSVLGCSSHEAPRGPAFVRISGQTAFETAHLEVLGPEEPAFAESYRTMTDQVALGSLTPVQFDALQRSDDPGIPVEERLESVSRIWKSVKSKSARETVRLHLAQIHAERRDPTSVHFVLVEPPSAPTVDRAEALCVAARAYADAGVRLREARELLREAFGILAAYDAAPLPMGEDEESWRRTLENRRFDALGSAARVEARAGNLAGTERLFGAILERYDTFWTRRQFADALALVDARRAVEEYVKALELSPKDDPQIVDAIRRLAPDRAEPLLEGVHRDRPEKRRVATLRTRIHAPLPAFRGARENGELVTDAELVRAKRVTILTIFESTCGPCVAEQDALQGLQRAFGSELRIVVLSIEPPRDFWQYLKDGRRDGFDYLAAESPMAIRRDFRARGVPVSVVLDREGRIAYRHVGYGPALDQQLFDEVEGLLAE